MNRGYRVHDLDVFCVLRPEGRDAHTNPNDGRPVLVVRREHFDMMDAAAEPRHCEPALGALDEQRDNDLYNFVNLL